MVLNGHYEFVGSDKKILEQNLAKASAEKMTVQVKNIKIDDSNNSLSVTYELEGDWKGKTVNVALVQKEATTKIGKGENGGRTLINHNIVRGLLSENAAAKGKAVFNTISDTYRIVVYVQDKSMKVVGAGMSK
jgi:hypothetical protein